MFNMQRIGLTAAEKSFEMFTTDELRRTCGDVCINTYEYYKLTYGPGELTKAMTILGKTQRVGRRMFCCCFFCFFVVVFFWGEG